MERTYEKKKKIKEREREREEGSIDALREQNTMVAEYIDVILTSRNQ